MWLKMVFKLQFVTHVVSVHCITVVSMVTEPVIMHRRSIVERPGCFKPNLFICLFVNTIT